MYHEGDALRPCTAENRFKDNSIDMGTGFDCFDAKSHTFFQSLTMVQIRNRQLLLSLMAGFKNYEGEWWHFTLIDEPYKTQYFDFDI